MSEIAELFKQSVPDADLRLHLLGDRYDLSRYRAEFTNINGAVLGYQMHFTAASSQYLRYPVADWRSADSLGTITAWIRLDTVVGAQMIFASSDEGATSRYFWFYVNGSQLTIKQRSADASDQVRGSATLVAGIWYYVALVSTGIEWIFYINGVTETLVVVSGANNGDWLDATLLRDNVMIGAEQDSGGAGSFFDGNTRVVKYRSRIVPAGEVLDEYETQKRAF